MNTWYLRPHGGSTYFSSGRHSSRPELSSPDRLLRNFPIELANVFLFLMLCGLLFTVGAAAANPAPTALCNKIGPDFGGAELELAVAFRRMARSCRLG
jgi:hypothetical protein